MGHAASLARSSDGVRTTAKAAHRPAVRCSVGVMSGGSEDLLLTVSYHQRFGQDLVGYLGLGHQRKGSLGVIRPEESHDIGVRLKARATEGYVISYYQIQPFSFQ